MRYELLAKNLPLAVGIVLAGYAWSRAHFRTPKVLRLRPRIMAQLVTAFGWFLVGGVALRSIGGQFGDARVAIAHSGQMYAYREREPVLFWGQIVGELILAGGTGAVLILLGHRQRNLVE